MSSQSPQMEGLNSILRLMRQREDNFFRLLDFVTSNLNSEHQEQLTITHNFIQQLQSRELNILKQEQILLDQNADARAQPKLASRLCARLLELYENSLLRVRATRFDNDKVGPLHQRFAETLNAQVVKSEPVVVCTLFSTVFEYSKAKYSAQFKILSDFVDKLDSGQDALLRDLYTKSKEPNSTSCQPQKGKRKSPRKSDRTMRESTKIKEKRDSSKGKSSQRSDSCGIVNKMMKLYNALDPSRIQFAEDLIYEEKAAEQHRSSLMTNLIEKNKLIGQQISNFLKTIEPIQGKILVFPDSPKTQNEESGAVAISRHNRASNFKSESQIKANLKLIAEKGKRNQPQIYDGSSGAQYHSDTCKKGPQQNTLPQSSNPKRPQTLMKQKKVFPDLSKGNRAKDNDSDKKPTTSNKSSRVYVVKATVFEDEGLVSRSASNKKKGSKDDLRKKSSKKINRSLVSREYKGPPKQEGTLQNTLEASRAGTGRRQFNLRLKKQVKKSIITTQLEQANQQIGSYIFPE